jgi:hypothetical protein
MTMSRHLPPDACFDDPAANLEPSVQDSAFALAGSALLYVFDWIMNGELRQRSLRFHLVALCVCPAMLPCKHPSAAWCGRIHGVSRQRASLLQQEFTRGLGPHIQFRGQRFRSTSLRSPARKGRT